MIPNFGILNQYAISSIILYSVLYAVIKAKAFFILNKWHVHNYLLNRQTIVTYFFFADKPVFH